MAFLLFVLGCSAWLGSYPSTGSRVLRRRGLTPTFSDDDTRTRFGSTQPDSFGGKPGGGTTDFEDLLNEADSRARLDGDRQGVSSRLRDARLPHSETETPGSRRTAVRRADTPWPSDLHALRVETANEANHPTVAPWPAQTSEEDFEGRFASEKHEALELLEEESEAGEAEAGNDFGHWSQSPGPRTLLSETDTGTLEQETTPKGIHLRFRLEQAETDLGEHVLIVGGHAALGNWLPAKGLRMTTDEKTYPSWTATLSVPFSGAVEYKYVLDKSSSGEDFVWEDGENRKVQAPLDEEGGAWEQQDTAMGVPGSRLVRLEESKIPQRPGLSAAQTSASQPSRVGLPAFQPGLPAFKPGLPAYQPPTVVSGDADARSVTDGSDGTLDAEDRGIFEPSNVRSTISVSNGQDMMQHVASLSVFDQLIDSADELADLRAQREEEEAKLEEPPERYAAQHLNTPIVVVASEMHPWSKTGGLAMIASSYAFEFTLRGHRTMAIAPMYDDYAGAKWVAKKAVELAGGFHEVNYYLLRKSYGTGKICDYVFVSHPCFRRSEGIYGPPGEEFDDNLYRFALFSLAAAEAPLNIEIDGSIYGQDVLFIANDWQTGILPVYLLYKYKMHNTYVNARSILVIHNIGFQGKYSRSRFPVDDFLHLPAQYADKDLEGEDMHLGTDCINLLAGGIRTADRVLTVSPNYANEIQSPEGGNGIHLDLQQRAREMRLSGILNGISDEWSPATDKVIPQNYNIDDFEEGKLACKTALQQELGLNEDVNVCLIGFCGRLCFQKGLTLIMELQEWLMHGQPNKVQLILMGKGEEKLAAQVSEAESNYKGRICGYVGFDPSVERRMMAGCDILLMPSQYEPCGLPQMYAQAYGTLPVVHETGGLKDSVRGLWDDTHIEEATGFLFSGFTSESLKNTLYKAIDTFHHRKQVLQRMQVNAMRRNFYWPNAMDEYEKHVDWTLEEHAYKKAESWWSRPN